MKYVATRRTARPAQNQQTLFEEDYLVRTLGSIATNPETALTELVANAWDAGASIVEIAIPDQMDLPLVVEDDGAGMTREQFYQRWMKLGYNRLRHQGEAAEFPPGRSGQRRAAYGRNGIGRHGLLCFDNAYEVQTTRGGKRSTFTVTTTSGVDPFRVTAETVVDLPAPPGTRLTVTVRQHRPSADRIRDVLSARFLHDPAFTVRVNGSSVPLSSHAGLIEKTKLDLGDGRGATAYFVDTTKAARTTKQQGIAFWIGRRLVGAPSWALGTRTVIDGRTTLAKRYTVVIESDSFFDDVASDWSGFKINEATDALFENVHEYVSGVFRRLSHDRAQETKEAVLREHRSEIEQLQPLAKLDVAEFVDALSEKSYTMAPDVLSAAVEAVIRMEKSKSGGALLEKLAKLSDDDIEGLDRLLGEWSVRDALTVLGEIDRRLAVVEALAKLSKDPKVDELKTLHPLVTEARWLFGPEYESAEYASNLSLRNAVEKVFKERIDKTAFINPRRRPDLIILADATLSAVAVDTIDGETSLSTMHDVLVIELKRGGFDLERKEMEQATGYVEDILGCGLVEGKPRINAFVVGHSIRQGVQTKRGVGDPEFGVIRATTYWQLVRTAEQRLFKLRDRLKDRYDTLSGSDALSKVLAEPLQLPIELTTPPAAATEA